VATPTITAQRSIATGVQQITNRLGLATWPETFGHRYFDRML
jgi:hypothetical protein